MRPDKPHRGGFLAIVLAVALLLPVGYVLSLGPAFGLLVRGYMPERAYVIYTKPISALASRSKAISNTLNWYIGHFAVGPPGPTSPLAQPKRPTSPSQRR